MLDAVIVGAGPGGSATAHFLAQRGLDVLLLDKFDFPRDKTCGDGLTPRAARILERMGMLAEVAARARPIDGYEVVAPNGGQTRARITSQPGALVMRRRELDELILRRAVRSGARFRSRVSVERLESTTDRAVVHTEQGETIHARAAIIATGAATRVLRRSDILRHKPQAMLAARAYVEGMRHEVGGSFQLRLDNALLPGYGWVFPVAPGVANIGVGFLPSRHPNQTASQAFDHFVAGRGMRQLLDGATRIESLNGYPIRVDFRRSPTHAERTLLVGEAAGLVNPLTGEGIDYALESGSVAAEHLAAMLEHGDFSAERGLAYDTALRTRFERIFRFSEHIRDWYCLPPLLNALVPLANRRPELRQLLANIILGEREPRGYGPLNMLVRLLVYLVRTRPGGARHA